ncbi:MAG TPA: hypothetical protein VFE19_07845 [Jatrophihabitantaceae bacterium]|jgi:hypothetical protein|nr:hypothetical protein [Jatrophihabitantaceae bacterium]
MIGGFSPGFVLGPVFGTSGGRLGWVGRGGPLNDDEDEGGELDTGTDVVGGETDALGPGVGLPDPLSPDDVQATHDSTRNAANVQIRPTIRMMPHQARRGIVERLICGKPVPS